MALQPSSSMSLTPEPIPIGSQKRDPAWKHCQLFKNGNRVQIKCNYCGKILSGGGIHRFKGHLAGEKGDGASCVSSPPDVRLQMQQSLGGSVVKKKKKRKAKEMEGINPEANEMDTFSVQHELNTGLQLLAVPDQMEPNSGMLGMRDEGMTKISLESRDSGEEGNLTPIATSDACLISIPVLGSARVSNQAPILGSARVNHQVQMAIGRFLYDAGVPLNAVNSVYFQPMIDAIASQGPRVAAPSYHDLRGWVLKSTVEEVKNTLNQHKEAWGRMGCSVLADEWTTETGRKLINFLVYCPEGTMFLRSVDVSEIIGSPDTMYELFKEVVEEVGVASVLQVITDGADHYILPMNRLAETFPTMYWIPCAARCVDLMLEDFGNFEWINIIIEQAKSITRFIYNHSVVLNMMRRYTSGNDLVEPAFSRSAANFIALQRIVMFKHSLQTMVSSQEWVDCPYSKKPGGLAMIDLVCSQSFWSSCTVVIHLTEPLLRILRMACNGKTPGMGYIYAGIYRAKEAIKKELVKKKDFLVYWNVIDHRWNRQLQRPLHAAGFYLNPKLFYSIKGDVHSEISSGMLDCIEKLVPDITIQDKIIKELNSYKNAVGDFGRKMAIRARDNLLPAEWWSTYGGGTPNLARLAIRILSQTCSAVGCSRDQIPFEQIRFTRNCLENQRLSDLVFVQYNLRLRQMIRKSSQPDPLDPISFDNDETVEDWIVDKEVSSEEYGSADWMSLVQPAANYMLSVSSNDEAEGLGTGFEDDEIYNGIKDEEDSVENHKEPDSNGDEGHERLVTIT